MLIEINTTTYYGDQLDIVLEENHFPSAKKSTKYIGWFLSDYGDGRRYGLEFDDNAKSISKALYETAKLIKEEDFNAGISAKDVADLAKVLDDNLLGDEFYTNLKTNLTFVAKIKNIPDVEDVVECYIYTNYADYSLGNNLCYFGEDNAMSLIKSPDVFKQKIIKRFIEKNCFEALKILGLYTKEIKKISIDLRKQDIIAKLNDAKKDIEKYERELNALKKEREE